MGIAKSQFNNILSDIFKSGNKIELFSTMPNASTESGAVKISGSGYESYIIKSGDFSISSGSVQSIENMMFYLCENTAGHGVAKGFGVYNSSNELLYFGEFKNPMTIAYNTIPTIKKFNGSGEGIKITMTSTEAAVAVE